MDRDLPGVRPGLIPGHEIVGTIERLGADVTGLSIGQRVGVPWLGSTCGTCPLFPDGGREPLRCARLHGLHA
ncbi:alcohol dehydrogenase catalytic domain-containing protein [Neoroseomonas lacus]|uniref:alcohol dehydrogenase catalytic domain-containing protein n=1 Tax=Neoroseomonas lacus TaxID=287609 RepID=UPI003570C631